MTGHLRSWIRPELWPFVPAAVAGGCIVALIASDLWRSMPGDPEQAKSAPGESVSVTVFHTVTRGALEIVTGRRFDGSAANPPILQYCYVSVRGPAQTNIALPLARKEGDRGVITAAFGVADGQPFGLSPADLRALAKDACRFASAADPAVTAHTIIMRRDDHA